MRSKVAVKRHPIHPMLVAFPVAFYCSTLVAFALAALGADPETFWFRTGTYANVAGVITALIAAVPGLIDWMYSIPPGTPAKRTGAKHMAANLAALTLFIANMFVQLGQAGTPPPSYSMAVGLPLVGVLLTAIAGWYGFQMVQTHHVGVDLTREQEDIDVRVGR